jgi:hypothetical protein
VQVVSNEGDKFLQIVVNDKDLFSFAAEETGGREMFEPQN